MNSIKVSSSAYIGFQQFKSFKFYIRNTYCYARAALLDIRVARICGRD